MKARPPAAVLPEPPADVVEALLAAARALPKPAILKALRQQAETALAMSGDRAERLEAHGFMLLVELGERAAAVLAKPSAGSGR